MKKIIWKYELDVADEQTIKMPDGAEILSIHSKWGIPCLWALVDPSEPMVDRLFQTFGTGHEIEYGMGSVRKYLGTYQMREGALIFHVFENTGI